MIPSEYTYSDVKVGNRCEFQKRITRKLIEDFSEVTGDHHPLHTDLEYSKENGYKDIIAHGMLTSALASRVVGMYLPGRRALLLSQSFEYIKPVYPDEVLQVCGEVTRKVDALSVIIIDVTISDGSDDIVSRGKLHVKVRLS